MKLKSYRGTSKRGAAALGGVCLLLIISSTPIMTITVAIFGSKKFASLSAELVEALDRIIRANAEILIADSIGANARILSYLRDRQYRNVKVFCCNGDKPKTFYPVSYVCDEGDRDKFMCHCADYSLAVWDFQSEDIKGNIKAFGSKCKVIVPLRFLPDCLRHTHQYLQVSNGRTVERTLDARKFIPGNMIADNTIEYFFNR